MAEFDSFSDDFSNFDDDESFWDDSGDDSWGGDSWGEEENAESPYGLPGEYGIQMFVQPINNTAQQNKDNDMTEPGEGARQGRRLGRRLWSSEP